jgi:hypothetical protein
VKAPYTLYVFNGKSWATYDEYVTVAKAQNIAERLTAKGGDYTAAEIGENGVTVMRFRDGKRV